MKIQFDKYTLKQRIRMAWLVLIGQFTMEIIVPKKDRIDGKTTVCYFIDKVGQIERNY